MCTKLDGRSNTKEHYSKWNCYYYSDRQRAFYCLQYFPMFNNSTNVFLRFQWKKPECYSSTQTQRCLSVCMVPLYSPFVKNVEGPSWIWNVPHGNRRNDGWNKFQGKRRQTTKTVRFFYVLVNTLLTNFGNVYDTFVKRLISFLIIDPWSIIRKRVLFKCISYLKIIHLATNVVRHEDSYWPNPGTTTFDNESIFIDMCSCAFSSHEKLERLPNNIFVDERRRLSVFNKPLNFNFFSFFWTMFE